MASVRTPRFLNLKLVGCPRARSIYRYGSRGCSTMLGVEIRKGLALKGVEMVVDTMPVIEKGACNHLF